MIHLADVIALMMLVALIIYALLAGADFGGGIWDLFAFGPRAKQQRALIEKAIAPVWEANHVWLILVVVMLFTAFPTAFSAAAIALHVPLTLLLLGIVLRGSAFVFRQYGGERHRTWGRVFAVASFVTPAFLGVIIAAVTSGGIRVVDGIPTTGFFAAWTGSFALASGSFTIALFAFLAATYLTTEADDPALADDFRARALVSALLVGACAPATAATAGTEAVAFRRNLLVSWWSWPVQIAAAAAAITALTALGRRRFRVARLAAIAQVTTILLGWGLAQRPYLIAPDLTIAGAAAPATTLVLLLAALAIGSIVLLPSLYQLIRVFKMQ